MRKKISTVSIILPFILYFMVAFASGCANKKSDLTEGILLGEHEDVVRSRYNSMSGDTQYLSYSVYQDFTDEQMEDLGRAWYEQVSNNGSGPVSKCSLAFYNGDSDELLNEFYYTKDGVTTEVKNAYYIPGDMFQEFEPER